MQKVYISSTYKDFKEYRTTLISLFHKQLKGKFELCEIMEHMFDDGSSSTYVEECVAAVKECDIYFIILGNSVGSYPPNESRTYTEIEYQTAMEEDKFIYRLQLENIDEKTIDDPVKHKALRDSFEGKHVTYFNDEAELEGIFLKSLLNHFKEINTENPYRGMDAFQIEDGGYFFGREEEIEKFIKLILTTENKRVFSVVGDSGIGKSSFVKAGVMHRMLEEEVMGYSEHIPLVLQPGEQPMTNLKYQLRRHAGIHGQDLTAKDFEGAKILLLIEHLEELQTQGYSEASIAERAAFVKLLNELATHPDLNIVIFLTYRSDFVETLSQYPFVGQHAKEFYPKSFDFRKNNAQWEQSITEIITAPAEKHGVSLESELVSSLIQELEGLDGCLPILQMTLYQLWDPKVIKDHQIKYSELLKLSRGKGLIGLLQNHANSVASKITKKGKDKVKENILKSMLVNLVEVSDEHGDLKRNLSKKKLFQKLDHYPVRDVEQVFEELVSQKSRLLLVSGKEVNCDLPEGTDEGSCVTLVHEQLISKWPKLQQWVEERRDALKLQKRMIRDVQDFEQKKGRLYRGRRLRNALSWQKNNKDFWDHSIQEFLKKSKKGAIIRYSIPIVLLVAMIVFKFTYYDNIMQKNFFLREVVNSRPELLQNFLDGSASLDSAQTISLMSGSLQELNGRMTWQFGLPLKKNLRFFNEIKRLDLRNNPDIKTFEDITSEMEEHSSLLEFKSHLSTLSLEKLNRLTTLKGIANMGKLEELILKNNFLLSMESGLEIPDNLETLYLENNDGISQLPDLRELKKLQNISLIGNDRLINVGADLPNGLKRLLISGNSRIDSVYNLSSSNGIEFLDINYNDKLVKIAQLESLENLRYLKIQENPLLKGIPPLANMKSLDTLELGIPLVTLLPELPEQLKSLTLDGNRRLWWVDLSSLDSLSDLTISNNRTINKPVLPSSLKRLRIENNDNLSEFYFRQKEPLESLVIKGNSRLGTLPEFKRINVKKVVLSSLPSLGSLEALHQDNQYNSIEHLELDGLASWLNKLWMVAGMKNLKVLKIQGETFEYNFELKDNEHKYRYRSLQELTLHDNQGIDFDYFPSIVGISSLKKLVAENNAEVLRFQRLELDSLQELQLINNKKLGALPDFSRLPQLQRLIVSNNPSLDSVLDLSTAPHLQSVTLNNNNSIGDLNLSNNQELRELKLIRNNHIEHYDTIGKLGNLESLHLEKGSIYLNNVKFIENLPKLRELYLWGNKSLDSVLTLEGKESIKKLSVRQNYRLASFPDLNTMSGLVNFEFADNTSLTTLPGFNDKFLANVKRLTLYGNSQLQWKNNEDNPLTWKNFSLDYLELDTKTFKQLFLDSGILNDRSHFGSKNQTIKTLVIRHQPDEDLRALELTTIKKKNKDIKIVLKEIKG